MAPYSTCLTVAPDRATVRDLGSRNHTRVNSWEVTDAKLLSDGDWLHLSDARFQVRLIPDNQPPDPTWLTVRPEGPSVTVDQGGQVGDATEASSAGGA